MPYIAWTNAVSIGALTRPRVGLEAAHEIHRGRSRRDHSWIEGRNLIIDYRSAEGHAERLPALAAELVALKPDLLVGPSPERTSRGPLAASYSPNRSEALGPSAC
jgi:hypothetical protein